MTAPTGVSRQWTDEQRAAQSRRMTGTAHERRDTVRPAAQADPNDQGLTATDYARHRLAEAGRRHGPDAVPVAAADLLAAELARLITLVRAVHGDTATAEAAAQAWRHARAGLALNAPRNPAPTTGTPGRPTCP
ncbi:hypothetical protein FRAHR75_770016 [Frankia sp. Hr75.2]|nr:hypothetical protein FRAHR75_770016 [Frankia sp. Hr75.2]